MFAARANFGSLLSLLDSVVTGNRGIGAEVGSYADIDCLTEDTAFPCSLHVTRTAGFASLESTAALTGQFAGQVFATDRGEIQFFGAQQTSTGIDQAGNPLPNVLEAHSNLVAAPDFVTGTQQSQLKGHTQVSGFSRALLIDATTVNGTLACDSAGDAWKDAGVIVTGGPVTGCEHVP